MGIVVVGTKSTTVIGFDGSSADGERPPVTIQPGCCGSVVGMPVGDRLILIDAYRVWTWVLDPETVTWRALGDRPGTGDILGAAVIGDVLYVVNAAARTGGGVSLVSALDLNTGKWTEVEQVPSGVSVGGVTTDGERLIVAGVLQDMNNRIIGDSRPVAYQHGVEGWRRLPDIPINGQASTIAWVEGAGLLAWNYDPESALLPASGVWEVVGSVPMDASECYPRSFQTEGGIVGLCGGLAYFDAESRSWAPIPMPFPARYVAIHDSAYQLTPRGDITQLAAYPLSESGSGGG